MSSHEPQEWLHSEPKSFDTIAGAPIEARGKTLIPLATKAQPSGFSSWLKFLHVDQTQPLGFLVVSDRKTQFVKIQDRRWLFLGLALAVISLVLLIAGISLKTQKNRPRKPALW